MDDREPDENYEELVFMTTTLEKYEGFKVIVERIPVGDYVCGELCAERKELDDFVASITDGRIFDQMKKMHENYKHNYILITGNPRKIDFTRMKGIYTVLADAEHRFGIHSRFCFSEEMLLYYFLSLAEKLSKPLPVDWSFRYRNVKKKDYDNRVNMLCGLPNFAKEQSTIAVNTFLSIHDMCHASVKDLMNMKGFGKVRAQTLHDVLNKQSKVITGKKPPNSTIERD